METIVPKDYSYEIESLEKLITTIQSNLFFTISVVVAILAVSVTISGWALSVLAKKWVNERVDEEFNQIDKRVKKLIKENPNILYASGTTNPMENGEIVITGLTDFNSRFILTVEVWTKEGLHLEKIVEPNKDYLSIKCPQIVRDRSQISWAVTWFPYSRFNQG